MTHIACMSTSAEHEFGSDNNAPTADGSHECSHVIMSLFNLNSSSSACILTYRSSVLHHRDLLYCRSVACWASALFVMLIVDIGSLWRWLAVAQLLVRIWPLGRAAPHYSVLSSLSLALHPPAFNNASTGEAPHHSQMSAVCHPVLVCLSLSAHVVFKTSPLMQHIHMSVTR